MHEKQGGTQSDWNQADEEALDYIKNKPSIYTKPEADEVFQPKGDYQPAGDYAPASDTARIANLEAAVGSGGSVDSRITTAVNGAKTEIKGTATSTCDTLGKAESLISEEATARSNADAALSSTVGARLDAQDDEIALLNGNEVVVVEDHTAVVSPDTQKIYREYGTDSYTDWMCTDATTTPPTWQPIATYSYPGIDDEPTPNSNKIVKSGGLFLLKDMLARNKTEITANVAHQNSYLTLEGTIASHNSYYVTEPFLLAENSIVWFSWTENAYGTMCFLAKATGPDDTGADGYTPVNGASNYGYNAYGDSFPLTIKEAGWYVLSWRQNTQAIKPCIVSSHVFEKFNSLDKKNASNDDSLYWLNFYDDVEKSLSFNHRPDVEIDSDSVKITFIKADNTENVVGWIYPNGTFNSIIVDNPVDGKKVFTLSKDDSLVLDFTDRTIKVKSDGQSLSKCYTLFYFGNENQFTGLLATKEDEDVVKKKSIPFEAVANHYISPDGQVIAYNGYFYSRPVEVKRGEILSVHVKTSGQAIFSMTDAEGTYYNPVSVIPPNPTLIETDITYTVENDGYICYSANNSASKLYLADSETGELNNKINKVAGGELNIVPDYWITHLNEKSEEINEAIINAGDSSDSFVFVTDTHNVSNEMRSPALIKYLLSKTLVNKVIHGGDVIGTYNKSSYSANKIGVKKDLEGMFRFVENINPLGKLLTVRGNHDVCSYGTAATVYGLTNGVVRSMFMDKFNPSKDIVLNEADEAGSYFYYDNNRSRIRYIVFDTTDTTSSSGETIQGVGNVQMKWIITQAINTVPAGYNLVFVVHIPVVQNAASDSSWTPYGNVRTLCDAIKHKRNGVVINGVTYNFSTLQADLLMVIGGHTHGDVETYVDGVLHVSTSSDAHVGNSVKYSLFSDSKFKGKTVGKISEQLFDVVVISQENDTISLIRVGDSGYSRLFSLTQRTVAVGGTIQLPSTGVASWQVSDSDGLTYADTGHTPNIPIPATTRISISGGGLVTGLASGEALACATMSDGKTRKFYYIYVQ